MLVFGTGTVSVATTVTIQEGYLSLLGTTLSATTVDVQSATLMGYGTIEGSVTNDGYLTPLGSLTVTGNYTQTSGGELSENWGYGQLLNVNGSATLSGYLVLGINPKRPPKAGSTDTFMTYGSVSGEFTSVPPLMSVAYDKNSAVATYK